MRLLCKVLWVEHEELESYIRMKLTRSVLRILCDLNELGQDRGLVWDN